MRKRTIINWGISSFFGWGVYGLNLALAWSADPDIEPVCAMPLAPERIGVDPLRARRLEPFVRVSTQFADQLKPFAKGEATADAPLLSALGNDFKLSRGVHDVQLFGKPTIGVTFFESALDADAVKRASAFPLVVTGSSWNERILRAHGVTSVKTVIQGIDPTLFHPAPRSGYLTDRFLVFSGGKLERRKGQDIVLAGFARFAKRHPEAMLVSAWHSPWPQFARSLDGRSVAAPLVFDAQGRVDASAWAVASGVPAGQFVDLGAVPNPMMPQILREMDVALFPNRGEGGTNLVAMECMACGVPTILSANTGHLDLIDDDACFPLLQQGAVGGEGAGAGDVAGWGETDPAAVDEALERAFVDRQDARRRGEQGAKKLAALTWRKTAAEMKAIVLG